MGLINIGLTMSKLVDHLDFKYRKRSKKDDR